MIKKHFLWISLLAALVLSGSALLAQAPAGPEKVMVYNGESLKVQLTGDIRLNMVQNQYNIANDTYGLWVSNQKWGQTLLTYPAAISRQGDVAVWLPQQANLTRGSLFFDVRYSQLGLTITAPGVLGGYAFGRFEVDFYGGFGATSGNVSRQPVIRLRNAFAGLGWQKDMFGVKVTFGQYTSIVTPVLAYPVGLSPLPFFNKGILFDWDQGVLLSFIIGTPKVNVMIDADIARAKAGNDAVSTLYAGQGLDVGRGDERGNGEATMRPAWHGRIAFNLNPDPIFGLVLAVQGHYYTERTPLANANIGTYTGVPIAVIPGYVKISEVPSKSIGAQAKVSVWIFTLQAAGWMGENMDNFVAMFGTGWRESVKGMKNLAEKGRGGYAGLYVVGPKIGIPVMLFVQMGQEIKNNNKRFPNATASGISSFAAYAVNSNAGQKTNSEVSGGLWVFLTPQMKVGYEVGQIVTHYQAVYGSSASMVHRATAAFTF